MRQKKSKWQHSHYGLEHHGLTNLGEVFWNLPTPRLYEKILTRGEGRLSHLGPITVRSGTPYRSFRRRQVHRPGIRRVRRISLGQDQSPHQREVF